LPCSAAVEVSRRSIAQTGVYAAFPASEVEQERIAAAGEYYTRELLAGAQDTGRMA